MNGMPGVGGSLGQCAMCGKPFLSECLGIGKVVSFTISQVQGDLYCHQRCADDFGDKKTILDWPEESPVRKAILAHNEQIDTKDSTK